MENSRARLKNVDRLKSRHYFSLPHDLALMIQPVHAHGRWDPDVLTKYGHNPASATGSGSSVQQSRGCGTGRPR